MAEISLKEQIDNLIKSIKTKISLVGNTDAIIDIRMYEGDYCYENLEELKSIETILKRRVTNYRLITSFLELKDKESRLNLTLRTDDELNNAAEIIRKCNRILNAVEKERNIKVTDRKKYLSNAEKKLMQELISPSKSSSKIETQKKEYFNPDANEEFFTKEELEEAYGEDITLGELNKSLGLNIKISDIEE